MDRNKLQEYTSYFLKGKLSTEKEQELLLWIKQGNENHEVFLKEQKRISKELLMNKNPELNRNWKVVRQRITSTNKSLLNRRLFLRVSAVSAAFIFGVLTTILVEKNYNYFDNSSAQVHNVMVPYGAKTNFELPDGSEVWLNAGSTLSYSPKFKDNRPVKLKGEAFFEVKKSEKPFVVTTDYGNVEVKGTSFNVKAYEQEYLQTTLVSGSVLISDKEGLKEAVLDPGQQACVVNQEISISEVDTEVYTSWKEGKLIFRKEFLPMAVKRIERWYNVKIELDNDKRLNDIWINGTLEMESFYELLELVKVTSPIDYSYNEKTRTIKIKYKQK